MISGTWRRLAAAGLLAGTLGVMMVGPAAAQDDMADGPRTITVTGVGSASGSPDIAFVDLGVELRSEDISEAVEQVNTTIAGVIEALVAAGIPEDAIQTTNFSVYQDMPVSPMPAEAASAQTFTYVVSNMVRVRVAEISLLSAVIDAGLAAGANRVFGPQFAIDDQTALQNEALTNAVADAQARAETLAAAIGATLGQPIRIQESSVNGFPVLREAAMGMGGGGTVIAEGTLSVSAQVDVTYALVDG